jgi:hypothetical protein
MLRRRLLGLIAVAAAALIITAGIGVDPAPAQSIDVGPSGLSRGGSVEHLSDSIVLAGSTFRDLGAQQVRTLRSPFGSLLLRFGLAVLAAAVLAAALRKLRASLSRSSTAAELWIDGARPGRGPPVLRIA